jgi:type I restriction enzyme R subunit
MRQAIEEGFILDVLQNYTAYKLAFRLTHDGEDDGTSARWMPGRGPKGIMGWVRLHPYNIAARVQIVVEHFRQNVAHLLSGRAKAMVVTSSRKEAVRWMRAMEAYIKRAGLSDRPAGGLLRRGERPRERAGDVHRDQP